MSLKIKELPVTERPYEKLEMYGEKMLSNSELLAIIIKNGTKDFTAIDISNAILKKVKTDPALRRREVFPLTDEGRAAAAQYQIGRAHV